MQTAIFGQVVAISPGDNGIGEKWSKAAEAWLADKPANTRRAYRRAWGDLLSFTGKAPWAITSADIKDWVSDLKNRPVDSRVRKGLECCRGRDPRREGLSASTIRQYLAAVSSFYVYVMESCLITVDGREEPLFPGPNPTRAVKRPEVEAYGRASYLDVEQLRALLRAIRSYTRNPLKAKRDYALFLCYIATGRRNTEIRTLQWGDLEWRGNRVYFRWSNKGKTGKHELPEQAWQAIEEYLRLAGRLDGMQPDDYIFTPLSDRALCLGKIAPAKWTQNRPLSAREVGRLLKFYARRAGLDGDRVHVHMLRHSAAMLRYEAGADPKEICELLGHSSLAVTSIYLHRVAGRADVSWARVADLLGL